MITINLVKDRPIINMLGEICWGFFLNKFEEKIGAKKEVVESLLERLLREEKAGLVETHLNVLEVKIIKRAFAAVEQEIEEWEFETRIGVSIAEANEIRDKL